MISHLKLRHVAGLLLFLSIKTYGQSYMLKGDYFLRSSPSDLTSENTKIGVLHKGSTFRVVNRIPKANGEALEIEVTSMVGNSYIKPSSTGSIFIYKSKNDPLFSDRSGPEEKSEAGVSKCLTCGENGTASENRISIAMVADKVVSAANQAPKAEATRDEDIKPMIGPAKSGSLDDKIKKYSESPEVARMIDWAMKNKNSSSKGGCWRKVKEAAAYKCGPNIVDSKTKIAKYVCRNPFAPKGGRWGEGNNLIPEVPTGVKDEAALTAKTKLKEYGFVNLLETEPYKSEMKSPSQAPKGAILVYSSGIPCRKSNIPDCGHVEIKTDAEGKPGYVSDFYLPTAINETPRAKLYGSNYKLVGIMIKPKE